MKKTLLSLAIASTALISQSVAAHSSIIEKEITEGASSYLTVQVPHGCKDEAGNAFPTKGLIIKMPNTEADVTAEWALTSVAPSLSWYKQRVKTRSFDTTNHSGDAVTVDLVEAIAVTDIDLPSPWVLKVEFRAKAPMLPAGETTKDLYFDVIQYCPGGLTSEWTVANGKAPHVAVVESTDEHAGH